MIAFPSKRVFGLIGGPRVGKDSVAQFLQESRDFKAIAFADRIKEEFGFSNDDFEAAKIAGYIEELRLRLWDFSAEKKKESPLYFINLVTEDVLTSQGSVVITDIRTPAELKAISEIGTIYWIARSISCDKDTDGMLIGSKINYNDLCNNNQIRTINNTHIGLFAFFKELENYFFQEDMMYLSGSKYDSHPDEKRMAISKYLSQFEVRSR